MSTVTRHSLKKSNRSRRQRTVPPPGERPDGARPRSRKSFWRKGWVWVIVLSVLVLAGSGFWYYSFKEANVSLAGGSVHSSSVSRVTSATTPIATVQPTWRTILTLNGVSTGNATKKTQTFTPSANWQITWACQGVNGVDDWLYIAIYYPDGRLYNSGAQITCIAANQVTGSVQEAKGGTFYLTVDANTAWTITIQDAK